MAHCISDAAGAQLRRLAEVYELVWATGWEARADDHLPPLLGLPTSSPALTFDGRARFGTAHWKLEALDEYAGERALAWMDDSLDESCHAWAAERAAPTLLCPPSRDIGLTEAHTEALLAWARDGYTAAWEAAGGGIPTDLFLMVVLKIPVGPLLYLVWWAFRAETLPEEAPPDVRRPPLRPLPARAEEPARSAARRPRAGRVPAAGLPAGRARRVGPRPHRHCGARCSERRGSRDKGGAGLCALALALAMLGALASNASANDPVYGVVPQDGAVPSRPEVEEMAAGGVTRSA